MKLFVPLLFLWLGGCAIGGDPGGHVPPRGAISRAVISGEAAHLGTVAEIYDKLADELEAGNVLDGRTALETIESGQSADHAQDLDDLRRLLSAAAETKKFGMRQVKLFRQTADAYRQAAKKLGG